MRIFGKYGRKKMSPNIRTLLYDVYGTNKDIEAVIWRMYEDPAGPMSEDEIINTLQGIIELHKARCRKLQQGMKYENK